MLIERFLPSAEVTDSLPNVHHCRIILATVHMRRSNHPNPSNRVETLLVRQDTPP